MSPLHVVLVALADGINREQQKVIDYLKEESRVLREQLGNKRRSNGQREPDRDPLYTRDFRKFLRSGGVKPVRLPARSPNLYAYAERFVLSIKSECLDELVLLGERHLRTAVREYVAHYHEERNHPGLGSRLIEPPVNDDAAGASECRERLGGLLRSYYRNAA